MSDKQRADHVQAKYWGGPISRAEAQKVFDEYGQVITAQAQAIQKLDAVISCIAEKLGVTPAEVNEWMKVKAEAAQKAAKNAQANAQQPVPPEAEIPPTEPSKIVLVN